MTEGSAVHIARLWKLPALQNQMPTGVVVRSLLGAIASFKITYTLLSPTETGKDGLYQTM
jgi:hypothetical protein